ncbi:neprilysin-2-like [Microplitis mediator]|uniref:neprilysin-2-like n=1 Tax=Microplitis mediator TaxID=375433 RepID=UPI002556E3AC|nr:neprilysin-2-like [Microplitis mediator]
MMTFEIFNKSPRPLRLKKQSSVCERKFFLIVSVGLVCSILPINTSAAAVDTPQSDVAANKCTGNTCAVEQSETATRVTRYRDVSVNPCDNFYKFACGSYKKTDKSDDYNHLETLRNDQLKKLIQKGTSSEFKPYKLIDDIYKTCINKDAKGQQALDTLKRIIKSLGSWPILEADKWKEADFNWIDFSSNAKKAGYNINYFLDWEPLTIYREKKKVIRYSVAMARSYFANSMSSKIETQKQIYSEYMLKISKLFGVNTDDITQQLNEAFDFEIKLQEINSGNGSDYTPHISIEQLKTQCPTVEWDKFVEKTLMPFVDADEKPILTVRNSTALAGFAKLIESTPKRVQANYAVWKIIQYSVPYLTEEFREALKSFNEQISLPEIPQEDFCVDVVKKYAEHALNSLYLDQYKSSQETIKTMVGSIKEEMIKMVKDSKTLNEEDKNGAIEVVNKMIYTIGPSEKLSDPKELEKFYADAQVVEDNFLQTILNLNLFKIKKEFGNKVQLEVFPFFIAKSANPGIPENFAGYLYIPTSMIPSPYFNVNRPMYMNFGASGTHIAINIYKSLLFFGRKWTDGGELLSTDQVDCFRNQYGNSTDANKNNRHPKPEEDMIVQFIGFRTSRATYQNYVTKNGAELALAGLPYTPEQLFWISYAQSLCPIFANQTDAEPTDATNNQFASPEYKLTKILSNIPEISSDFKCPIGSNLNPEHKCTWW